MKSLTLNFKPEEIGNVFCSFQMRLTIWFNVSQGMSKQ